MTSRHGPLAALMGDDLDVPVYGGGTRRYVNLDNAATTPPLRRVWDRLAALMPWYGSIHRGNGLTSIVSTRALNDARETILRFADGDADRDVLLFGPNTTSCINHLARRLDLDRSSIVVTSELEHSSNILPWRKAATVISCRTATNGVIDLDHLTEILTANSVSLVAVTGASSITGAVLDTHQVARIAHAHGARVFVDAAQLVAHRKLDRAPPDSDSHLDFVAFAGHKMYAPFGTAVLIGPQDAFRDGWPDQPGGGSVRMLDGPEIVWAVMPAREQGGSPNYPGVVALAEACATLNEIGFDRIAAHEQRLSLHAMEVLGKIPAVTIYLQLNTASQDKVPVFPFNVRGFHHSLVAAFLGAECAIGVRSGPICQYELVARLLNIADDERHRVYQEVATGDHRRLYGIVRASCGIGSTCGDIDDLGAALKSLVERGVTAKYEQTLDGRHEPSGWTPTVPMLRNAEPIQR